MILQGRSFSGLERNCGFLNTLGQAGDGRFATISAASGLDFPDDGRALAVVDWDQDGDLDLWLSARNAPRVRLMLNQSQTEHHYLTIGLEGNGVTTSRDAIGARVELILKEEKSEKIIQTLRAGEGFLSQDSKWLHFGLGRNDEVDSVIVHWPGGRQEKFQGLEVDSRYMLIQEKGIGRKLRHRPANQITYHQSEPIIPQPSGNTRIPLMTRMPTQHLSIRSPQGQPQKVEVGAGGPVLVTLWASWCPTCKAELTEFTQRKNDIGKAGIGMLALSVDGLGDERSDLAAGKKLLDDLQFPYPVGFATPELIQKLQELHDLLIPFKLPLPVPSSFLFNGKGELAVIYKGRADIDDVIADSQSIAGLDNVGLEDISPFSGRAAEGIELERVARANKVRTYFKRGGYLAEKGEYEESILYNLKALDLFPDSYKIHFNLASAYLNLGKIDETVGHLEKSLQTNPRFHLSHKLMGQAFLRLGDFDKANYHYSAFLKTSPGDVEAINAHGVIAGRTGDFKNAEERLGRAVELDPSFVEARYNLGTIQLMQNKLGDAERNLLQILSIQPNYPDVLYSLGYIAELEGDGQRAANLYTGELRNFPSSVKAIAGIGRLLEKAGDIDNAKSYYSRALSINPAFQQAVEGLKRLNRAASTKKN